MLDLAKSLEYFSPLDVKGKIHIVGCGSVGATLAENLARLGLTDFVLWDFDKVEPHNLANQIFRQQDVGHNKVDALLDILTEINPELKNTVVVKPEGWKGQKLNGHIFLAVDSIDLRREIVDMHMDNPYVKSVWDFRTLLESAQHYAADWSDQILKQTLRDSMNFTHEEAKEETPTSACGVTLGVAPTVRAICAVGVANFVNWINGKGIKKMIMFDIFNFDILAF